MIQKLLFVGLLFVACIGLPSSIYLSRGNQETRTHVFAEAKITPIPSPKSSTLGAMQEATGDANSDTVLNILDYNIHLTYQDQTNLTLFLHDLKSQNAN